MVLVRLDIGRQSPLTNVLQLCILFNALFSFAAAAAFQWRGGVRSSSARMIGSSHFGRSTPSHISLRRRLASSPSLSPPPQRHGPAIFSRRSRFSRGGSCIGDGRSRSNFRSLPRSSTAACSASDGTASGEEKSPASNGRDPSKGRVDADVDAPCPPPTNPWRGDPPYLALITELDACSSPSRVDGTARAVERAAAAPGGIDLVVIRVVDERGDGDRLLRPDGGGSDASEGGSFAHRKMELIRRLAALKKYGGGDDGGRGNGNPDASFLLLINDDVEAAVSAIENGIDIDGVHVKERNAHLIPEVRRRLDLAKAANGNDLAERGIRSGGSRGAVIGTSCHSLESARRACDASPPPASDDAHAPVDGRTPERPLAGGGGPPDYLFVGTCYPTRSHPEKSVPEDLEGPALPGEIRRELLTRRPRTTIGGTAAPMVFAIGGIDVENCAEPVVGYGADGVATIRSVMTAKEPERVVECMRRAMNGG